MKDENKKYSTRAVHSKRNQTTKQCRGLRKSFLKEVDGYVGVIQQMRKEIQKWRMEKGLLRA